MFALFALCVPALANLAAGEYAYSQGDYAAAIASAKANTNSSSDLD
jgi:hypothetical protein